MSATSGTVGGTTSEARGIGAITEVGSGFAHAARCRARLTSPLPVLRASCRQSLPEDWVRAIPVRGVMPLRNLNSSLSVESMRVVFSPMMDL